jgi:uncharacterized membrane protein
MRNFWFLFAISVVPFTTALLGETKNNPLPVTLFSINLLAINVSLRWVAAAAERLGAAESVSNAREKFLIHARAVTTAVLIAIPAVLAWLIRPNTAVLLFLLMLLSDVPGRLAAWGRERRLRSSRM